MKTKKKLILSFIAYLLMANTIIVLTNCTKKDSNTTIADNTYLDPFDGSVLKTNFWQILDLTSYHEPGLNLYVNNALYIVRGTNNNNNGWYGIESIKEYPGFRSAKIDFWLDSIHNWQDHKIGFTTPFGMMGYYNEGSCWWLDYYKSNGDYSNFITFGTNGYNANHKYSFRISIENGTLKFEWDSGSGFQTVYETTDYSSYKLFGTNIYKKVNIIDSDKGSLMCDNFELHY